jgi:hypothetical protein
MKSQVMAANGSEVAYGGTGWRCVVNFVYWKLEPVWGWGGGDVHQVPIA